LTTVPWRAVASVALATALVVAGGCRSGGSRAASTAVPSVQVDPASGSTTDRAIGAAQERLRSNLADDGARLDLANAFLQKARERADPSLYTRADALLEALADSQPDDPRVLVSRAVLALARHEFRDALRLAESAVAAAPGDAGPLGVLVDSLNELGRPEEALEATQQMVDAKPNLASLSRASYARELRGDLAGAAVAMQQAVIAGSGEPPENRAFAQAQLGTLLLTSGDVRGADAAYKAALATFPGFGAARAGEARVLVARGRPAEAADVLAQVVEDQPLAEHAIALGDALQGAGRTDEAARAYQRVDAIQALYTASGVDVDLELALFAADRRPGKDALAQARRGFKNHPSLFGHDVLAWNLFKVGKLDEAAEESAAALRLGSKDPGQRHHAAAIALARGDREEAARHLQVVVDTNPRYSAAAVADVERLAREVGIALPPP
jgi:tetratricopeptide (TPR) repeat protein